MNKMLKKKLLVTCALPYANGPIHIGHILEHVQADIWVRYHRMRGYEVWFICSGDAHGTPIMLKSEISGLKPEHFVKNMINEHKSDFISFGIYHDNYHSTHSKENHYFLNKIYTCLKHKKLIKKRVISQLYDPNKNIFLPDRFVQGICPICLTEKQYGDHCENCGSTYSAIELIHPKSIISGAIPVLRNSEHLFFDLPFFQEKLKNWINSGVLQKQIINKVQEWFKVGLKEWDISRDAPYFGFEIPNHPGKYFYVWLDAPIGYISSFKNFCNKRKNINFNEFWSIENKSELYHFIGKDIIYFHSLFWPAILDGVGFRKPTKIFVHGYVTIRGSKMSKSRGSFIKAKQWIKHFDADSLRYYYASKSSSNIEDIEINLKDFLYRINSDIVNKVVNLASRTAVIINKKFDGILANKLENLKLYKSFIQGSKKISNFFESRDFNLVIKKIMMLSDEANRYINDQAPWKILEKNKINGTLHLICSMGINLFRVLMTWLKPIVPFLAKKAELFLNVKLTWNGISKPLLNHKISVFETLYSRIHKRNIDCLLDSFKS